MKGERIDWAAVENAYIYGERSPEDPPTKMPTFLSLDAIAVRFGLGNGTVKKQACRKEWTKRREEARPAILKEVHEALLRQSAEAFIPAHASLVAIGVAALTKIQGQITGAEGGLVGARTVEVALDAADQALRNIHTGLGVKDAPALSMLQNIGVFVGGAPQPADVTPPAPTKIDLPVPVLGSPSEFMSTLLGGRALHADADAELMRSFEDPSILPANLSANFDHGTKPNP